RNREHVLHRHQKIPVDRPLRLRYVAVHRLHELLHRRHPNLRGVPLERLQRRPDHDRRLVPRKLVRRQQIPNLHLHQLQKLRIVHLVRLVQVHHDVRHTHLTRQQYVLPRLRHRTVRRTHHQDRSVHLRRTRDHVLHIVRVPGTVHVRVMPLVALVLHVRRRYRDPTRLLLRRVVDLVVSPNLAAVPLRHHLRQRRRQRRLPVIHVTNRPYVHVRLRTLKLSFRHGSSNSGWCFLRVRTAQLAFLMTLSATLFGTSLYFSNSIEYVARPWLIERRSVAYPNISASGTIAPTILPEGESSMPVVCPRRRFRSPMTSPMYSSGVTTSTFMIGSSNTGLAFAAPSLKPIEPAILKAISLESTSWYEPSYKVTLTST